MNFPLMLTFIWYLYGHGCLKHSILLSSYIIQLQWIECWLLSWYIMGYSFVSSFILENYIFIDVNLIAWFYLLFLRTCFFETLLSCIVLIINFTSMHRIYSHCSITKVDSGKIGMKWIWYGFIHSTLKYSTSRYSLIITHSTVPDLYRTQYHQFTSGSKLSCLLR